MAGFTSDEIQTAISRFLVSQVSVAKMPVTKSRDVLSVRAQVYDLLTTTLLLRPGSYFYLIWLGKNRLRGLVRQQIALMQGIDGWAPDASRVGKRVETTTELTNAEAAVLNLNAGLNLRSTGVRGSIGPAVERFRAAVERFITTELTKNVLVSGEVTETGEELRSNIATAWAAAQTLATQIEDGADGVTNALTSLGAVRLPESSVRAIVGRIEARLQELRVTMEGSTAIAESRGAMLDLLTMRTLLARAASFQNPTLALAPRGTDTSSGLVIDSDGDEPFITGTISGPFNYDEGALFNLSVNGSVLVGLPLPGTSGAEIRSQALSFPSGPGGGGILAIHLDYAASATTYAAAASYASGAAAAADLTNIVGATVTWDPGESRLVFHSQSGDDSRLLFELGVPAQEQVTDWLFGADSPLILRKAVGAPASVERVALQLNSTTALISAEGVEEAYSSFSGARTATGGEEDLIWNLTDFYLDLAADGTTVVTSPSRNFEAMGVDSSYGLVVTAPVAGTYAIASVDGASLTLDAVIAPGTLTYYIGPDYRAVPVGTRVQVTGGDDLDNTGYYRLLLGEIARIQLDMDMRAADTQLSVTMYSRLLKITSRGTTTSTGIGVLGASAGATAFGYTPTASETVAGLTSVQISGVPLLERGIRVGDTVTLTSSSLAVYITAVTAVSPTRVEFAPSVPAEAGAWTYAITSAQHTSYDTLAAATSAFAPDLSRLDQIVGRLAGGGNYTATLSAPIQAYIADLQTLDAALDAYVIGVEPMIDSAVQTMREQGLDRAADLLLALEIEEFFTMEPAGVSYSTNLVRQAATTTREVTPIRKSARSDRIIQEFRSVSFQPTPYDPLAVDDL